MKGNPVALITGSGRRLGRQIAYALAMEGFDIIVNYNKSHAGARETVRRIKAHGNNAIAVEADISSREQVSRMVKTAIQNFKRIDLLINNSGIFLFSPLQKTTELLWDETLNVNLKGTFLCSQIVSQFMLRRKRGRIINIASLGGIQAWHNYLPYSVSKAGVIMLTRCLAKALAPAIMVNAIAPGTIIIPSEESSKQQYIPLSKIPLGRYGNSADITSIVLFLATTSEYITGQTFAVDGGRSI
jgi:3-oxoacyl-[acyl-carrier protein] reductase